MNCYPQLDAQYCNNISLQNYKLVVSSSNMIMDKLAACINSVAGYFEIFYLAYDLVILCEILKVFKMSRFYFQLNILQNYVVLKIIKHVTKENVCVCACVRLCVSTSTIVQFFGKRSVSVCVFWEPFWQECWQICQLMITVYCLDFVDLYGSLLDGAVLYLFTKILTTT